MLDPGLQNNTPRHGGDVGAGEAHFTQFSRIECGQFPRAQGDAAKNHRAGMPRRLGGAQPAGTSFSPGRMFSPQENYGNYLRHFAAMPWDARVDGALAELGHLAKWIGQVADV